MTSSDSAVIELIDSQVLRQSRAHEPMPPAPRSGSPSSSVEGISRRGARRVEVQRSVVAFPVAPDGAIDMTTRFVGSIVDAAAGGLGLRLNIPSGATPAHLVVGVVSPNDGMLFQGIELRHVHRSAPDEYRLGARFAGPAQKILEAAVLTPRFDPQTMQFRMPVAPEILEGWVRAGILRPRLLDRVQVCPRCDTLATFRSGCRSCKSGRIEREQLIHHFRCAHVDRVGAFEHGNHLRCPKCQQWPLIVGADFDYQEGVAICLDCRWQDSQPVQIGHCFRCGLRFPAEQAKQYDLMGYDVLRLDPLALLTSS